MLQLSVLFQGLARAVPALPEGWKWFNSANGLAQALKMYTLEQFRGDTTVITAINPATGAPGLITTERFVSEQLGASPDAAWWSFGALLLIMAGSLVLSVVLHIVVRGESR